jgi:hypothetical protein
MVSSKHPLLYSVKKNYPPEISPRISSTDETLRHTDVIKQFH